MNAECEVHNLQQQAAEKYKQALEDCKIHGGDAGNRTGVSAAGTACADVR